MEGPEKGFELSKNSSYPSRVSLKDWRKEYFNKKKTTYFVNLKHLHFYYQICPKIQVPETKI